MSKIYSTDRELWPVLPPEVQPLKILYIPGFCSGNESQENEINLLKQIFPDCTINALAWEGPASKHKIISGDSGVRSLDETFLSSNDPDDSLSEAWKQFVVSADLLTRLASSDSVQTILKSPLFLEFFKSSVLLSPMLQSWLDKLSKMLPISFFTRWENAKRDTDNVADALANRIAKATKIEQEGLFLIGHSLGANIVVKTLAQLNAKHIKINQAALLGAAIDNDDPNIEQACGAVLKPISSIFNPYDHALMLYCLCNIGHLALGSAGYSGKNNQFREYHVGINQDAPSLEHSSCYYIQQWDKLRIK